MSVKHKVKRKPMEAGEIRAELARRKMTRKQLSDETGIGYQYLVAIVNGYYPAVKMRTKITNHLFPFSGFEIIEDSQKAAGASQ